MDQEFLHQGAVAAGGAGKCAYQTIPADEIRRFFDSAFPTFAKNTTADIVSGGEHRWVAGHDLLLDVPKTFTHDGFGAGVKHLGHVLLTDFPTKKGIPIPGLSKSGLGDFLVNQCHVPTSCLNFNLMSCVDGVVGVLAGIEGAEDLINVCSEGVRMTPQVFFDTFIEGSVEIYLGAEMGNYLLVVAGGSQVLAGAVSTAYTITHPEWFVLPEAFFGGVLTGGALGFAVSKFVFRRPIEESLRNAVRGCLMSGLFAIEAGFGLAALCGFLGMALGRFVAEQDNRRLAENYRASEADLIRLTSEYAKMLPGFVSCKNSETDPHSFGIEFPLAPTGPLVSESESASEKFWGREIGYRTSAVTAA